MAVGDLIRVDVDQFMFGSIVQNVMYWVVVAQDDNDPDVPVVAQEFLGQILPPWKAAVTDDVSFDCLTVQKVFPLPVSAAEQFNVGEVGDSTGEALPSMDAALIQKLNPAVGGVGKKGRVYVAGIDEAKVNAGRLEAAQFALMQTLATAMEIPLTTSFNGVFDAAWAVKSNIAPFPITDFVTDLQFRALPRIATQRRRRTPIRATS